MNATIPLSSRSLAAWITAFVSPAIFFLLLLVGDTLHLPSPPDAIVATLFYLIPIIALFVCGLVVLSSHMTVARKLRWMIFTTIGMLLQFGVLLAIMVVAAG